MKRTKLNEMGADELRSLHLQIVQLLQERIQSEKAEIEKRLQVLKGPMKERRAYPPVSPKFRNPKQPSETWSGRGEQPRWLVAQLKSGKRIDDFRIKQVANKRREALRDLGGNSIDYWGRIAQQVSEAHA